MWRSSGIHQSSAPQKTSARPGLRVLLRVFLTLAVVALIVVFLFPVLFEPHIDVPAHLQFASPSGMMFQISNQNLTPLTNLEYTCEVSKVILANGSALADANVLSRGNVRKIAGRRAVAGRCQTGTIVTAPVKTVEYKLTLTYRAYPWPQLRRHVSQISADINAKGEVTGWKLE